MVEIIKKRKMKQLAILAMILMSVSIFAQESIIKIKVYGNCGECKERIESAAMSTKGVKKANWDPSTEMLNLSFDSQQTRLEKVEDNIVKAGHDLENKKASKKDYNKLPHCCMYTRDGVDGVKQEIKTYRFRVIGLDTEENSTEGISQEVYKIKGVKSSEVLFSDGLLLVIIDTSQVKLEHIISTVENYHGKNGNAKYKVKPIN